MSRTSGAEYPSIMKRLNLQENWPSFKNTTSEVQLLRNLTNELEYKYIRPGKSHPNYYRIELFMQRLNYLSTMGMTPKDKLKLLKRKPPVLVLCQHEIFDSSGMMYLRGVMKEGPEINYIFYPAFPRTACNKALLDSKVESMCETLKANREQVLKTMMSMPCFSINPNVLQKYENKIVCMHKRKLPENFDFDLHTFEIMPPIFSGIHQFHLLNHLDDIKIPDLPGVELASILDLAYTSYNGKGKPEDFTEFMDRAYKEERKYDPPTKYK